MNQKYKKYQVLYFQECMDKKKLETLKSSTSLNMKQLREEQNELLNYTKDNGTTETIEELDKLRQNMEDKKVMLWKLVRNQTCS